MVGYYDQTHNFGLKDSSAPAGVMEYVEVIKMAKTAQYDDNVPHLSRQT